VIFYSVREGAAELEELAGKIDREMSALGFRKEKRPYHPHLTLARIKKRPSAGILEKLQNVPPLEEQNYQDVKSFQLLRSHLSRSGARYEIIADFELPDL
jgi:2'-5' RNA ligase